MSDEKKPAAPGPVVIRKGQVEPLPQSPPAVPRRNEQRDDRPLWQRVAERQAGSAGAPPRAGGSRQRGGGQAGGRGAAGRPRGERPPRADPAGRAPPSSAAPPRPAEPPPALEPPAPDEGSFADLLAGQATEQRRRFEVGDKVAGKIIQLGLDVAFLELGSGVAEGMIEVSELLNEAGQVEAKVGDIVDGVVVKGGDRGVVISKGHGHHRAGHDRSALVEAARTGLPVEGVVKAANKGGLEVEVMGHRAFCPMSQIDLRFVGDPAAFVGQKLRFKVQRADARDAVLSRRALLEEERAERARKTRERLSEGAVLEGVVTGVQEFGAFVDLGGIEGLVHVSELSWDRASKPGDLLSPGDAVKVQVLKIEQDARKGERISLSVKTLSPRPAQTPAAEGGAAPQATAPPPPPAVGDVVKASVDRIEPFGIFVRFAGGRGLVPASETGTPRGADLKRSFKVGDELDCLVTAIDEQGRIRLSRSGAEAAVERREARDYMARAGPRSPGKGFGTLGDLLKDKLKR